MTTIVTDYLAIYFHYFYRIYCQVAKFMIIICPTLLGSYIGQVM